LINYLLVPKNIICTIVNLNVKSWLHYFNMSVEINEGELTDYIIYKYICKSFNKNDRCEYIIKLFDFILKHKGCILFEKSNILKDNVVHHLKSSILNDHILPNIYLIINQVEQDLYEYIIQFIVIKCAFISF